MKFPLSLHALVLAGVLLMAGSSHATLSFFTLNRDTFTLELAASDGSLREIGPLGVSPGDPELAIHRNRLYLIDSRHAEQKVELYEINQQTGAATHLGRVTAGGADVIGAEALCSDGQSLWLSFDPGAGISNRRARLNLDGTIDEDSVVATGTVDVDALTYRGPGDWIGLDVHNPSSGTTSLFTGAVPNTRWSSHSNTAAWTNDIEWVGPDLWGMSGNPANPGHGGALARYDGTTGALLETIMFAETGSLYGSLASAPPSPVATAKMVLVNPGFEDWDVTSGGPPTTVGHWNGDKSLIHSAADQGVSPRSGGGMIQFLGTELDGGSIDSNGSEILQLVDLSPIQDLLNTGQEVELEFSCYFNRIAGDAGTDTNFHVTIYLFEGPISEFGTRWPSPYLERTVTNLVTDSDPGTWERATTRMVIPAGLEYVALRISASENIENDGGAPAVEFDGHYADDAMVTVRVRPPATPMTLRHSGGGSATLEWGVTVPQQGYLLQKSTDLQEWTDMESLIGNGMGGLRNIDISGSPTGFYRLVPLGEL